MRLAGMMSPGKGVPVSGSLTAMAVVVPRTGEMGLALVAIGQVEIPWRSRAVGTVTVDLAFGPQFADLFRGDEEEELALGGIDVRDAESAAQVTAESRRCGGASGRCRSGC